MSHYIVKGEVGMTIAEEYNNQLDTLLENMDDNCTDCFSDDRNHFLLFKDGSVIVEPSGTFCFTAEKWKEVKKNVNVTNCWAAR